MDETEIVKPSNVTTLVPVAEESVKEDMMNLILETIDEIMEGDWQLAEGLMISTMMEDGEIDAKVCNLDASEAIMMLEVLKARSVEIINDMSRNDE